MIRRSLMLAVVVTTAAALSACGDDESPVAAGRNRPSGATDVVVQVDRAGGFLLPLTAFGETPAVTIYGDGTSLTQGAMIEIFPGPAYVPLQRGHLDAETIEILLDLAVELGLLGSPVDAGQPPVADAPATIVTIDAGDGPIVHRAEALFDDGASDQSLTDEQRDARARLWRYVSAVEEAAAGATSDDEYAADAILVRAEEGNPDDMAAPEGEPQPRFVDWTVSSVDLTAASTCLAVTGEDAAAVEQALRDADQLTMFNAADRTWRVVIRPVLPHESGCPEA